MGPEVQDMPLEASAALMVNAASGNIRCSGDQVVIKTIAFGVEEKSLANAHWTCLGEINSNLGVGKMRPT